MEQLGNFPTCFGEKAHQEAGGSGIRLRGKLEDSKQVHVFQSPGHQREGDWTLAAHMVLTCTDHGGSNLAICGQQQLKVFGLLPILGCATLANRME